MIRPVLAGAFARACVALLALAVANRAGAAFADEARSNCVAISIARGAVAKQVGGRWIDLTDLQRAFAAGVYVLNPNTPPGLPFGDKAALAQVAGDKGGVIFFVDGDLACSPMPVPEELIEMLQHIGQGDVFHEGTTN